MNAAAIAKLVPRFLRRALAGDFQRERAADDERQQLAAATPPIADPLAQDYAAWRRAALWLAGVLLAISVTFAAVEHQTVAEQAVRAEAAAAGQQIAGADLRQMIAQVTERIGKDNAAIMDGLMDFLLAVKIAVATLTLLAAWKWQRLRRSRALARWALISALVIPLLVSAWPWAQSLDFTHLQNDIGEATKQLKRTVSLGIAGMLVLTIGPKLIALFPGIIRSSMALKTLLPEAAAPGWLVVVFGPFLAGFLLLVVCFLGQVQGSWLLLGGIGALVFGPVLYVRKAASLVRPHSAEEVGQVVGSIRHVAGLTNVLGAGMLVWYLFTIDWMTWTQVVHLMFEAGGGIFLTMVAISDITLALLAFSQRQSAQFQGSALRSQYEQRLQSLTGSGLTDVEGALGVKDLENLRKGGQA